MIQIGKATSGLILLASGGALLVDWSMNTNYLGYAEQAWPLIFIVLGIEYLWIHIAYRNENRPIRLNVGGVLLSVLVAAAIVAYSRYGWPPSRWFDDVAHNLKNLHGSS
ncbi:hypothetical protein ACFFNY_18765 [Paenibacillus hodogayensis]|uniref:DUF5668 domain-containing protein n=1 Tax=Paenibacillus hodogayensis TaxID=279208 RepID=A0ABV5VZ89_9BACL